MILTATSVGPAAQSYSSPVQVGNGNVSAGCSAAVKEGEVSR